MIDAQLIYEIGTLDEQLRRSIGAMYFDPVTCLWVATIKDDCWAPGIWAGMEGWPIKWEWANEPPDSYVIAAVDLEKKTISLSAVDNG